MSTNSRIDQLEQIMDFLKTSPIDFDISSFQAGYVHVKFAMPPAREKKEVIHGLEAARAAHGDRLKGNGA
tara:strand:+ start:3381 stop:3590 length:210 start_codon:yes stop_codon:yes gene_type:complete